MCAASKIPALSSRLPRTSSRSAPAKCATGAPESLLINPALSSDHKPAMCSDSNSLRSVDRNDNKKSSTGPENSGAIRSSVLITRPRSSDSGNTNTSTGSVPPLLVWQRVMPCAGTPASKAWLMSSAPLLGRSRHSKSSMPVRSRSSTLKFVSWAKWALAASIIWASPSNSTLFSAVSAIACAACGLCGDNSSALTALAKDRSSARSALEKPLGLVSTRQSMPAGEPPRLITSGAPA